MIQRYFKLKKVVLFILFLFFGLFLIELAIKKKNNKNVSIITTSKEIYFSEQTNSAENIDDQTYEKNLKNTKESKDKVSHINWLKTKQKNKDLYGQNYVRSFDNDEISGNKDNFKTDDHIIKEKEYDEFDYSSFQNKSHSSSLTKSIYEPLKCNVNNEYQVDCIFKNERVSSSTENEYDEKVDEEGNVIESNVAGIQNVVYVPFDFLSKYYEVHGSLEKDDRDGYEFVWKNSIVKIVTLPYDADNNGVVKKTKNNKYSIRYGMDIKKDSHIKENKTIKNDDESGYTYDGHFLWFYHYNVESRERVKCVSAKEGVPMSQQWGNQGYFYPTQIAQFGLSHYGKWLIDSQRFFFSMGASQDEWKTENVEDKDYKKFLKIKKTPKKKGEYETNVEASDAPNSHEIYFSLAASKTTHMSYNVPKEYSSIKSKVNKQSTSLTQLSFCISSTSKAVLSIVLETSDGKIYKVNYSPFEQPLAAIKNNIYYGYGVYKRKTCLYRNVANDLEKGLQYQLTHHENGTSNHKHQRLKSKLLYPITLLRVELSGVGVVKDLQLSNQNHLNNFFMASDWFVKNQDKKGGWAIEVGRVLVKSPLVTLQKGWYSGMSQGHAMSLLVRAYAVSQQASYLRCAFQALRPLLVDSKEGGVATKLFQQFDWLEEYPSNPPSFVLNGFMFAIFGLHDLSLAIDQLMPQQERCYYNGSDFGSLKTKNIILKDGLGLEDEGAWGDSWKKISTSHNEEYKSENMSKRVKKSLEHSGRKPEKNFDVTLLDNDLNVKNINISSKNKLSKAIKKKHNFKKQRKRRSDKKTKASSMMNVIFHQNYVVNRSDIKLSAFTACSLHKSAMKTLRIALPLYDSGSGSFYDLRHFSLPGIAPNVARWDYHSTHLSQLMQMVFVASHGATYNNYDVNLFKKYIERWTDYMNGKRAAHN